MNSFHNKENILSNAADQLHLPTKSKASKEQMISMRRNSAKQLQEITAEKQNQINDLKKQYQNQKQALIQKYEKMLQQKDAYIQQLEEICAGMCGPRKQTQSREIGDSKTLKIEEQKLKKSCFPNTLFLHQAPLYEDICYSIERPMNKTQKVGDFLNSRAVKTRLLSGEKIHASRGEGTKRLGSNSRHKLVPAVQPNFRKIL